MLLKLILLTSKERSVFLEDLKEENFHKEKGKKKEKHATMKSTGHRKRQKEHK